MSNPDAGNPSTGRYSHYIAAAVNNPKRRESLEFLQSLTQKEFSLYASTEFILREEVSFLEGRIGHWKKQKLQKEAALETPVATVVDLEMGEFRDVLAHQLQSTVGKVTSMLGQKLRDEIQLLKDEINDAVALVAESQELLKKMKGNLWVYANSRILVHLSTLTRNRAPAGRV